MKWPSEKTQADLRFIPGFDERYSITCDGTVWSHVRGRWLKGAKARKGYLRHTLQKANGRVCYVFAHRMVYSAWVSPLLENEGDVLHRNDVKDDNRVENLYLGGNRENAIDSVRNGLNWQHNKTHCKRGHEFTPDNIYWRPSKNPESNGRRQCKTCVQERAARDQAKRFDEVADSSVNYHSRGVINEA